MSNSEYNPFQETNINLISKNISMSKADTKY